MTYEVRILELYGREGDRATFTVADGTAITKCSTLKLSSDPRTVSNYASSDGVVTPRIFTGIAGHDKEASDGATTISVITNAKIDAYCSGSVTLGDNVVAVASNLFRSCLPGTVLASGAVIAGYALETGSDLEQIEIRLRGY